MTKEQNRSLMPKVTAFIDAVREEFGECKVSYASENGVHKGAMWPEFKPDPAWELPA